MAGDSLLRGVNLTAYIRTSAERPSSWFPFCSSPAESAATCRNPALEEVSKPAAAAAGQEAQVATLLCGGRGGVLSRPVSAPQSLFHLVLAGSLELQPQWEAGGASPAPVLRVCVRLSLGGRGQSVSPSLATAFCLEFFLSVPPPPDQLLFVASVTQQLCVCGHHWLGGAGLLGCFSHLEWSVLSPVSREECGLCMAW